MVSASVAFLVVDSRLVAALLRCWELVVNPDSSTTRLPVTFAVDESSSSLSMCVWAFAYFRPRTLAGLGLPTTSS